MSAAQELYEALRDIAITAHPNDLTVEQLHRVIETMKQQALEVAVLITKLLDSVHSPD